MVAGVEAGLGAFGVRYLLSQLVWRRARAEIGIIHI